jgi:putative spermidine/putrescine transport system substrate-binding protein
MKRVAWIAAGIVGALVIVGIPAWLIFIPGERTTLAVVSWAGAYTKSQIEAYHKPFMAMEPDISIEPVVYDGKIEQIKAKVESGAVDWDIVDFEAAEGIRACDEGLLETIDASELEPAPDGTPSTEDFVAGALGPCTVASVVFSHVMAYNTQTIPGAAPRSAADFFDVQRFPGNRGLRKGGPEFNLELALLADGVPANQLYAVLSTPAGVDRAFAKLQSLKPHIVWWESGKIALERLANGGVVMTTSFNEPIFNAVAEGEKPFAIIWGDQILDFEVWGIVKGTPRKDEALAFLEFATATGPLAEQARWIPYAPARKSSIAIIAQPDFKHALLDVPMLAWMPTAPENYGSAQPIDHRWWGSHRDALRARWRSWIGTP